MFFRLYFELKLIYEPFRKDPDCASSSLDYMNELYKNLEAKIHGFGFDKMRGGFLRLVVESNPPSEPYEAARYIDDFTPESPKDSVLKSVTDSTLADYLMRVKRAGINEVRNRVIHKSGYRPSREEAEKEVKEARSVLFPLTWRLNLHDDVNYYIL